MRKAWLSLGSNIGDSTMIMGQALCMLDSREDTRVLVVSSVYRTPPWGKTDQMWFYNTSAEVESTLEPHALLEVCLAIEKQMKRVRGEERWGPRTLDIDILACEGMKAFADLILTLPHPHMSERAFVLVPLDEIASNLEVNGRTVQQWRVDCDEVGIEKVCDDPHWWQCS